MRERGRADQLRGEDVLERDCRDCRLCILVTWAGLDVEGVASEVVMLPRVSGVPGKKTTCLLCTSLRHKGQMSN